tara:strand:+ start:693 stop:1082 length:390 start_codon:yes stop_codon:yes gene_type:complete
MNQFYNLSAIHIKDINLWAHVGVLKSERINGQSFILDITFWLDLDESSKNDQLDKSIDYSVTIKAVQKLSFEMQCLTIEYFSDQILNLLESLHGSVPMRILLKKCSPPINGFTGSVVIEKKRNFSFAFN